MFQISGPIPVRVQSDYVVNQYTLLGIIKPLIFPPFGETSGAQNLGFYKAISLRKSRSL